MLGIGKFGGSEGEAREAMLAGVTAVRATMPELLCEAMQPRHTPASAGHPPCCRSLWPAVMDSNAYSRGGRAEDSYKPRPKQICL